MVNKNEDIMAYALATLGEFAEDELERIEAFLKTLTDPVVIDVGANIGVHSCALAPFAQVVIAIEPFLCNYNILCANIALSGQHNVFAMNAIAGAVNAMCRLPVLDTMQKLNYGALNALEYSKKQHPGFSAEVRQLTIDQICSSYKRVDFIKIDVEGGELDVLSGARETLQAHKPALLVEYHGQERCDALVTLLAQYGYKSYRQKTRIFRPNNFGGVIPEHEGLDGFDTNIIAACGDCPELTHDLEVLYDNRPPSA